MADAVVKTCHVKREPLVILLGWYWAKIFQLIRKEGGETFGIRVEKLGESQKLTNVDK